MRSGLYAHLVRLSFGFYDRHQTGPADVARDRRPAGRALLPRLRPDLLLPERAHRRLGDRRPLLLRVAARADRARDHAAARRARVPLQPRRAPDAARRAAEARRRRDRRRGEHRRRPRREGVRAGAGGGGEVHAPLGGRLRADAAREPAARDLRAAHLVRAAARAGGRAARRRAHGRARLAHASAASSPSTSTSACSSMPLRALGMWIGQAQRATAAGERIFEIIDEPEEIADAPDARPLPPGPGAIRFENVSFEYLRRPARAARHRPRHRRRARRSR